MFLVRWDNAEVVENGHEVKESFEMRSKMREQFHEPSLLSILQQKMMTKQYHLRRTDGHSREFGLGKSSNVATRSLLRNEYQRLSVKAQWIVDT